MKPRKKVERHGLTHKGSGNRRLYNAWSNMLQRCYNEDLEYYADYGGRGVTVCKEWRLSFKAFHDWAKANGYKDGLYIDKDITRKGNKIYSPSTCCWVTQLENMQCLRDRHNSLNYPGISQIKDRLPERSFIGRKTFNGTRIGTRYFHTAAEAYDELQILITRTRSTH